MKNYIPSLKRGFFLVILLLSSTTVFSNTFENLKHLPASNLNIAAGPITLLSPTSGPAGAVATITGFTPKNGNAETVATTLEPEVAYLNIEDNVEGNMNVNENGSGVTFTINTTGVREGTIINFVFTGNLVMEEDFVRMEWIDSPLQVRVGQSGTAEVKAELNRNIEGYRNETLGIELKTIKERIKYNA